MSNTRRRIIIFFLLLSYPLVGGFLGFISELISGGLDKPEAGWGMLSAILAGFLASIAACILGPLMHFMLKNRSLRLSWSGYVVPGLFVLFYCGFLIVAAFKA